LAFLNTDGSSSEKAAHYPRAGRQRKAAVGVEGSKATSITDFDPTDRAP
jgi:hypothetical protein